MKNERRTNFDKKFIVQLKNGKTEGNQNSVLKNRVLRRKKNGAKEY